MSNLIEQIRMDAVMILSNLVYPYVWFMRLERFGSANPLENLVRA